MNRPLFRRVIIPVANRDDARATTSALLPYLNDITEAVIAVHVIEKAGGAPYKASVEQRETRAEAIFDLVREGLDETEIEVETQILYGTDIATTVIDATGEADASAIVFTPRGGSRWIKLLTGDIATTLVNESNLPILVLPDGATE